MARFASLSALAGVCVVGIGVALANETPPPREAMHSADHSATKRKGQRRGKTEVRAKTPTKDELIERIPHENSPWRASVGATALLLPRYDGASRYLFFPLPLLELSYRDVFTASVLDGLQVNLVKDGAFTAGPLVKLDLTQRVPRERPVAWVGTFSTGVEGGVFAEYRFSAPLPLKLRGELLQSFNAREGLAAKVLLTGSWELAPTLTLEAGPLARFGNRLSLDSRFGVDPAQSAVNEWPVFSPPGGLAGAGLEANLEWRVTPAWKASVFGEYDRLAPSVASSPVVRNGGSPNQFALGLSLAYRFMGP